MVEHLVTSFPSVTYYLPLIYHICTAVATLVTASLDFLATRNSLPDLCSFYARILHLCHTAPVNHELHHRALAIRDRSWVYLDVTLRNTTPPASLHRLVLHTHQLNIDAGRVTSPPATLSPTPTPRTYLATALW